MSSTSRHGGRQRQALLAALLACAFAAATAQQPYSPPGSDSGQDQVSTAMVALLAAVVAVFIFIAASTVYLGHCSGRYDDAAASTGRSPADAVGRGLDDDTLFSSRWSWWQQRRRRRVTRGLDAEAVEAFPTMTYAEAKVLRVGTKGGAALECAVCLSEFEDGDRLRLLLPRCSHAFHPDCIGEWLAGHVTCPVCRCNLEPSRRKDTTNSSSDGEPVAAPTIPFASSVSSETAAAAWQDGGGTLPVAVVIDVVTEEDEEDRRQEALELQRIGSRRRAMRSRSGTSAQLARWHSTGNSLASRLDRDLERFTLRLPEHVSREMVAAASEHSLQLRRSAPLGRSGSRWQSILGGTFSGKLAFFSASRMAPSSGDGEVSSSSSYTRLRGRRVAAVDVADVPAWGEGSTCLDRAGVGAASSEVAAAAPNEEKAASDVEITMGTQDLNAVET